MSESEQSGTALLVMDMQREIVSDVCGTDKSSLITNVQRAIETARKAGATVVYVVVRYRCGYPEANPLNKRLSALRRGERLLEGAKGTQIEDALTPSASDPVVVKRRIGAFSYTELRPLLSGLGVTRLALAGLTTSGVVLSTLRQAADDDFDVLVLEDCVRDRDPVVHSTLIERVFPTTATVGTLADLEAWVTGAAG